MRSTAIGPLLGLCVTLFVTPVDAARLVVPEFAQAKSDRCRKVFYGLIDKGHIRVDADQFVGESTRPADEDMRGTVDWLRSRGRQLPEVQIAVLGVALGKKIRIALYKLPEADLVGLKTFSVGAGCRLSPRNVLLAKAWLVRTIDVALVEPVAMLEAPEPEPEVPAAPQEPPEPADALPAVPTATVAAAPPPVAPPPLPEVTAPPAVTSTAAADPDAPFDPTPPKPAGPQTRTTAVGEVAVGQPLLLANVGVAIGSRSFSYIDPVSNNLGDYELDAMPLLSAVVEVYPLALFDRGILAPVGVEVGYGRSIGVETVVGEDETRFPTTFTQFHVGARYRFAIGDEPDATVVLPEVRYRVTSFTFGGAEGQSIGEVPSVSYGQVSFGLAAEVTLRDRIRLLASGAYLLVFDPGDGLAEGAFFKKSDASGFIIDAALRFQIIDEVGFQIGAGLENYFLDFESDAEDLHRAAGARDQIIRMQSALHFAY